MQNNPKTFIGKFGNNSNWGLLLIDPQLLMGTNNSRFIEHYVELFLRIGISKR